MTLENYEYQRGLSSDLGGTGLRDLCGCDEAHAKALERPARDLSLTRTREFESQTSRGMSGC